MLEGIKDCQKCELWKRRKNVVLGEGPITARIVMIGMAPGFEEDEQGQPFVGSAGRWLDDALKKTGINRSSIYIDNVIRCIPRDATAKGFRDPTDEEIEACSLYLDEVLNSLKFKTIIVPLGSIALRKILGLKLAKITEYRGTEIWSEKYNCKVLPTFHPAAVLRNFAYEESVLHDLKRIRESAETSQLTQKDYGEYICASTRGLFELLMKRLNQVPEFVFDIETSGYDFQEDLIIGIGFCWKEKTGVYLPLMRPYKYYYEIEPKQRATIKRIQNLENFWGDFQPEIIRQLRVVLGNDAKKIGQNLKFDERFLKMAGIEVNNVYFDTMLAHHLLDENAEGMHDLKTMVKTYTNMGGYEEKLNEELEKIRKECGVSGSSVSYAQVPLEILAWYGGADVDGTYRLYKIFEPKIFEGDFARLYWQIIMPFRYCLIDAEIRGIRVDVNYLKELKARYQKQLEEKEKEIYKAIGYEFNIDSPDQLSKVLFGKLGLFPIKKTPGGKSSTNIKVLEELAKQHKVPRLVIDYREAQKLLSTYIDGIEKVLDKNNRVHATWQQHHVVTGRVVAVEPAMQGIPKTEEARRMYIPEDGWKFIEIDWSAADFRIFASYVKDERMLQELKEGKDIYLIMASHVFRVPEKNVTSEQRDLMKGIVLGLMYGRGAQSIAQELGISSVEGQEIVDIFYNRYPRMKLWLNQIARTVRETGQVRNIFGRVRRLPLIKSNDQAERAHAGREAVNAPIQSATSDVVEIVALRIRREFKRRGLRGIMVLTLHDSLVYEIPDEEVGISAKIIEEEALRPIEGLEVTIAVKMRISDHWSVN